MTLGPVDVIKNHDVGILELNDIGNNAFHAATPLVISDKPPAVLEPVYLIGHSHNVPLKYTRVPVGSKDTPRVLARPDDPKYVKQEQKTDMSFIFIFPSSDPNIYSTCLTADIDKFPGNDNTRCCVVHMQI